jgi:hypothetical protein
MRDKAAYLQFDHLKPWRVCRLKQRFMDLASANAYAVAHGARFIHVMPEGNGAASAWELECYCEREDTARARLAELEAYAPPGVVYAAFRERGRE